MKCYLFFFNELKRKKYTTLMNKILEESPIFRGLNLAAIEELLKQNSYNIKRYTKNQVIALMGEKCETLMVLLSGSVKGEMADFWGKSIKIEDIAAPKPIASIFLFGKNNHFPVTVTANEDVEMLCLPKSSVIQMFQQNKLFLTNYLNMMANRTQFLTEKLKFLSFKTIRQKFAHFLLKSGGSEHNELVLTKTQQELSEMFGVTRPALARAIKELENDGIIEVDRKNITIKNKPELMKLMQ
jgi:CRP-like cAMP-binding protein